MCVRFSTLLSKQLPCKSTVSCRVLCRSDLLAKFLSLGKLLSYNESLVTLQDS